MTTQYVVAEAPAKPANGITEPSATQTSDSTRFRHTYRPETSLSPSRSSWASRSLSRARLIRKDVSPSLPTNVSPSPSRRRRRDVRADLPAGLSRFLGYRADGPPFGPLFAWQKSIPVRVEASFLSVLASFTAIIIVESVNIKSGVYADFGGTSLIVASLGATAVLLYSTMESPLAQPRNAIGGQFLSALTGIIIVRLVKLSPSFSVEDPARADGFERLDWLAAALSMSVALFVMEMTGTVHPPGGATALIVAVQPSAVDLSWRFLLVIFVSVVLMVGVGLLFNNLGRRRYPVYWFTPNMPVAAAEAHGQTGEGDAAELEAINEGHETAAEEDETAERGRTLQSRVRTQP